MLHTLQEKKLVLQGVQQHSNIRATLALASNGYGVTFLSSSFLPYFSRFISFDAYALLDVTDPLTFTCARRSGSYLPEYASALIRMIRDITAESS